MTDIRTITPEKVGEGSPIKLEYMEHANECDYIQAIMMLETIVANNKAGKPSMFIVPVGPVGYAERFADLVNEYEIKLKDVTIINMDEYMLTEKQLIDPDHPLSFIKFMNDSFYGKIRDDLNVLPENRIFPDPDNPMYIWERIQQKEGGVDICFGGIGIDGHIAFNEPPLVPMSAEDFAALHTRVLPVYYTTVVTNCIDYGGNYKGMPRYCVTIGMKEILSSKKLCFFANWPPQCSILRQVLHGPVTAEVPGSLMQTHPDATIYAHWDLIAKTVVV
jgi:glucosamine-6-phosphate deaminase